MREASSGKPEELKNTNPLCPLTVHQGTCTLKQGTPSHPYTAGLPQTISLPVRGCRFQRVSPLTRDHSAVTKTRWGKNPPFQNTSSFTLNCFSGIAVKNRAYSLKKTLQNNKTTHNTKSHNKQKRKNNKIKKNQNQIKQKNCKKIGRSDAWFSSCSTACSESCSAQLGAVLGCSTHTSSPQVFTQKHLQTTHARSWLSGVFFSFSKTALVFPGQRAGQLSIRHLCHRQTPAAPGGQGQVQPSSRDTPSKTSWGHTAVLGRPWSTWTLISQEPKLALTARVKQNLYLWVWRHGSSWPPALETLIFPADCCIFTAAEQTTVEMKRLWRIQHS